jgi:8-oxo-dGTP diphosphatase
MAKQALHIAVGVITNRRGEVLVALRPYGVHQGGLWEFPGGKVESGEDVYEALSRELQEELSVNIESARPLIRVRHQYPEYPVLLDVWRVEVWHGEVHGREGQPIEWVAPEKLQDREFPIANRPIIKALQLPSVYLITPDLQSYDDTFLRQAEQCLRAGIRLLQLRCPRLDETRYSKLLQELRALCHAHDAYLLINTGNSGALPADADGIHLPAAQLLQFNQRPLDSRYLVAASCHNPVEVEHACRLGLDFIVVSPVSPTRSHPEVQPMGWDGFRYLSEHSGIPVYALGGVSPADLPRAWQEGGQGIAMISAVWSAPDPVIAVRECVENS